MEDNKSRYAVVQVRPNDDYTEMYVYEVCIRLQTNSLEDAKKSLRLFRDSYPEKQFRLMVNE